MPTLVTNLYDHHQEFGSEWKTKSGTGWAKIDVNMNGGDRRHFQSTNNGPLTEDKPRLPNFSNFVAGVGHPGLAWRNEERERDSPPPFHSQQPFSPPSASSGQSWNSGKSPYHHTHLAPSPQFFEYAAHDGQAGKLVHRRQHSTIMPQDTTTHPQPVRSYSFTEPRTEGLEGHSQQRARVVREEAVPGRGVCYIYEDGSACPKVVNGDTVNPKWGTTKAGKPRKRLGQACNTCREKKIKCDPNFPKCSQCQKFGRDCKFETPSRMGQKSPKSRTSIESPTSSNHTEEEPYGRRASTGAIDTSTSDEIGPLRSNKSSMSVDKLLSPSSSSRIDFPDVPTPSKRIRLDETDFDHVQTTSINESSHREEENLSENGRFGHNIDPMIVDGKRVEPLLEHFFTDASLTPLTLFPQEHYLRWARSDLEKTSEDIMVLYAILALVTSIVKTPDANNLQPAFSRIAKMHLQGAGTNVTLQGSQTSYLLSLVDISAGRYCEAFQLSCQACAWALLLKLNTLSLPNDRSNVGCCNLNPGMLAECKRRTFWAIYILDSHLNIATEFPSFLNSTNILLSFPMKTAIYGQDLSVPLICFDSEELGLDWARARSSTETDTVTFLIQMLTLCKKIRSLTQRTATRLKINRSISETNERNWLDKQLKLWEEDYKDRVNIMDKQAQDAHGIHVKDRTNNCGNLSSIVTLCFFAHVQLNRYFHHATASKNEVTNRMRRAYSYAIKILENAQSLCNWGLPDSCHFDPRIITSTIALATFTAIDIITAAGTLSDVLENRSRMMQLVYKGVELLGHISEGLPDMSDLHRLAAERIQMVFTSVSAGLMDRKVAFYVNEPMKVEYNLEQDAIYGIERMRYLQILGWAESVEDEDDLLKINNKR